MPPGNTAAAPNGPLVAIDTETTDGRCARCNRIFYPITAHVVCNACLREAGRQRDAIPLTQCVMCHKERPHQTPEVMHMFCGACRRTLLERRQARYERQLLDSTS